MLTTKLTGFLIIFSAVAFAQTDSVELKEKTELKTSSGILEQTLVTSLSSSKSAQKSIAFELDRVEHFKIPFSLDSTSIYMPHYYSEDTVFLQAWPSGDVYGFSKQGVFLKNNVGASKSMVIQGNFLYAVLPSHRPVVEKWVIENKLTQVDKGKLKSRFEGNRFHYLQAFSNSTEMVVGQVKELYISPVHKSVAFHKKNFLDACEELYSSTGIIGVYNKKGKLQRVFGEYPQPYREHCLHFQKGIQLEHDLENEQIYAAFPVTHEIQVYSLSGDKIATFGEPGKFVNPTDFPVVASRDAFNLHYYYYVLTTPYYYNFHYDEKNELFFRFYKPAAEDTLYEAMMMQPDEGPIKYESAQKEEGCIVNPMDGYLFKKSNERPVYMQVYDKDYNLLYDGSSQGFSYVSGSEKGKIIRLNFDKKSKQLVMEFFSIKFPGYTEAVK